MPLIWRLKDCLEAKGIANGNQLHEALKAELGISISPQALRKLLSKQPHELKLQTAQILCDLLQLPLSTYLQVTPSHHGRQGGKIIHPFRKVPDNPAIIFDDPLRYL